MTYFIDCNFFIFYFWLLYTDFASHMTLSNAFSIDLTFEWRHLWIPEKRISSEAWLKSPNREWWNRICSHEMMMKVIFVQGYAIENCLYSYVIVALFLCCGLLSPMLSNTSYWMQKLHLFTIRRESYTAYIIGAWVLQTYHTTNDVRRLFNMPGIVAWGLNVIYW